MKADNANRDKHIRKFADARLRYQFFVFIICLLASISFWLLIKLSNEYTLSFTIPIKFENVPNNKMLTNVSDSSIQFTLKAQGYQLIQLRYWNNSKYLSINLSNSNKAQKSDEMTTDLLLMPFVRKYATTLGFVNEVRAVNPEQVTLKLNKIYSKSVPVKLFTDITFSSQYLQFEPCLINPSNVMVFGTRNMVDSVRFAQPEVIKIRNMNESVVRYVHLNSNTQGNHPFFIPSRIKVTIPVQKFTEESVEVPIKVPVQVPGHNIKLFPDRAVVSCIVSMKDYKILESRLFTVTAVLMKSDNMFHLSVTAAPDFVRNIKITPEKVEYLVLR